MNLAVTVAAIVSSLGRERLLTDLGPQRTGGLTLRKHFRVRGHIALWIGSGRRLDAVDRRGAATPYAFDAIDDHGSYE